MNEQSCAARIALEACVSLFENWRDGHFSSLGIRWEVEPPAIVGAREALAAPCEHAVEVERERNPKVTGSLAWKLCNRTAERDALQSERDRLRAKLEKAQALNHRWNRAASQHGPCGSEFHDDPERVFARVLEARQFASEVARVKAEKRANAEKRTELDALRAERQECVRALAPFANWFREGTDATPTHGQVRRASELHARLTQEKPEVQR